MWVNNDASLSFSSIPKSKSITDNPYGATCYSLSASAMVAWIKDFSNTYHSATTRYILEYLPNPFSFLPTSTFSTGTLVRIPLFSADKYAYDIEY